MKPKAHSQTQRSLPVMGLAAGLLLGLGIAAVWPHQPLTAATTDRNEKFGMCTVTLTGGLEAVFVLDFLTGRLTGASLGRQGNGFVQSFYADVAADFGVQAAKPQYAMVPGLATIQGTAAAQPAPGVIYVAELHSGKVGCYAIPFRLPNSKSSIPVRLIPVDTYSFRDPVAAQ